MWSILRKATKSIISSGWTILLLSTIFSSLSSMGQDGDLKMGSKTEKPTIVIPRGYFGQEVPSLMQRPSSAVDYGLRDLRFLQDPFCFRLWSQEFIIELGVNEQDSLWGRLVCFTSSYGIPKEGLDPIYFEHYPLNFQQIQEVLGHLGESKMVSMPDDGQIDGWSSGPDGITYYLELSTPESYQLKTYWTPSSKKDIPEANVVANFASNLMETCRSRERWSDFSKNIPFERYINGMRVSDKIPIINTK